MSHLTREPIDRCAWQSQAVGARDGASVEFLGLVRCTEGGQPITALDYEAYAPMAERTIAQLIGEAQRRWGIGKPFVRHRLGRVPVGQIAVLIGVAAPHREQAFEACRFLIEAIKRDAPIWKRAIGMNGAAVEATCRDGTSTD